MDNKERLKNVSNLEDLINFKVRTVADNLADDNEKRMNVLLQQTAVHESYPLELMSAHQASSVASINVLKKMCDPLLANRHYPKLMVKKELGGGAKPHDRRAIFNGAAQKQQEQEERRYEIPEELRRYPKNYNLLPPKVKIFPDIAGTSKAQDEDTMRSRSDRRDTQDLDVQDQTSRLERNDSFMDQKERFEAKQKELNEQSAKLKQEHARNLEEQEALL